MRITDYPDLLRTKGKEPMPQAWDETNQDWTPAIDSAATLKALREALGAPADATQADPVQEATAIALLKGLLELTAMRATDQTLTQIKTALTDGTQKVALTGNLAPSRKRVVDVSLSPGTSIATGAYETTTIRCSAGALASMRDFYFRVAAVPGATQGTHTVAVSTPTPSGAEYTLVVVSAPYNETLKIARDGISSVGVTGFRTREEWIGYLNSGSCVFGPDAASQISVWYHNGTDAAQTKARSIHYRALEEAVTW